MATRPKIDMRLFSGVDPGNKMELSAEIDGLVWDLVSVVADDGDESLWVQVYAGEHLVQIPAQTVYALLAAAKEQVHSETWFEQNVFSKHDPA